MMQDKAVVTAAIDAAIVATQAIGGVPPPPPPPPSGTIVALGLVFGASGYLPWAFAQTFKRGHVPAGASVVADCAEFQCVPWSFHDDGSVRDAHVAGYCQVAAPGRVNVAMSIGTPSSAPPFVRTTILDMQIMLNGSAVSSSARRTIASGAVMLHEQVTLRLDQQVAIVYEIRSFNRGETQILPPCLENTGFNATSQPNRVITALIVAGGVTRFNAAVDVKHHTRVTLTSGSVWEYWLGTDPKVIPDHDHAYLCSSESFPPYAAARATLPAVPQTYSPNSVGEGGNYMPSTGYSPRIGLLPRSSVFYLTTGGAVAWNYLLSQAFAAGSWSMHLRDESTNAVPRFSVYPTASLQSGNPVVIPSGSGAMNGSHDLAHQPSLVYVAAKVTGWRFFIDEHLAWTAWNHFQQHASIRQNAKGLLRTDVGMNQDRGAGWGLRTLAQAIAITPASDPMLPDLVYAWQSNMSYYRARSVDGTLDGGIWRNALGLLPPYAPYGTTLYTEPGPAWWGAGWMQCFCGQAIGQALQLALPIGTQGQDDTRAVFHHCAKLPVGLAGDGSATSWNWRRFGLYGMPFAKDGTKTLPNVWFASFGEAYAEYIRAKGLQALDPAPGGKMKIHSTETDITAADWQTGMCSYPFPAMVYAVMHGAIGASAAFARLMSSASWPLLAGSLNEPEWTGMMPPGVKHPGAP